MMLLIFLTAALVVVSGNEWTHSESCVANATHSEDCAAKGSPLMQKGVGKLINKHGEKRRNIQLEGLAIDDSGNRGHWESFWDSGIASLSMIDPIIPNDKMLNDSLNDGTIDRRYKSWIFTAGPSGPGETKFYHEVGVAMAHRKAWQTLIEKAGGDGDRYGLIFEADAVLRADFWRWMKHIKEEVLAKGDNPFMVYLGHCLEDCYGKNSPQFRDHDFCYEGNEDDNPHNVSGCMVHVTKALCTGAYLISLDGAQKMMEITTPMNCPIDEKLRYELQRNNWDARIMCAPLVIQPLQHEFDGIFKQKAQQEGYWNSSHSARLIGEVRGADICGPPGWWVRTIESWP